MPDKLTDSEVVRILELLLDKIRAYECKNVSIDKNLITNALDLINRLQAEKEVLEARIGVYETCNARKDEAIRGLEAENERLEKEVFTYKIRWAKAEVRETKAKAEAYKECIEKVKSEIYSQPHSKGMKETRERYRIMQILDNLLKELVGEDK
jgi:hypothetical protein